MYVTAVKKTKACLEQDLATSGHAWITARHTLLHYDTALCIRFSQLLRVNIELKLADEGVSWTAD